MFDFHMHSRVSFDGHDTGEALAKAALAAGLKEICFTDHMDYDPLIEKQFMVFSEEAYRAEYDRLEVPGLKIRRGVELGMSGENLDFLRTSAKAYPYDFVLGSVHFVDGLDVYLEPFWKGKTMEEAEKRYLEETLVCVQRNDDFDVLAHLNFISKSLANPNPRPLSYEAHREILDEILCTLADKGKGMEMNTSGVDRRVGYLPTADFFRRFKELGGEIVTVGSDAHRCDRVGQYCGDACAILGDIFGYVCTFENRKPIFHKL